MAKRLSASHSEDIRQKIQASQLIKRLTDHANGTVELSATQVRAAEILLRKSVPDLSTVTHTGAIKHEHVGRVERVTI